MPSTHSPTRHTLPRPTFQNIHSTRSVSLLVIACLSLSLFPAREPCARDCLRMACFGALVLCVETTSSPPVLQIPILHYEICYD